jgi:molybdate transport system permease protein
MTPELQALVVSLRVSALALLLMLPPGLALAWWLSRGPARGRVVVEALVMLPLVLPPVAIGVAILAIFGRAGVGPTLAALGLQVVATWQGAALASAVVALPVFVRVARAAIDNVDPRLEEQAALLGASRLRVLGTITLPLARRGLLAGATLGLARALGEFGATVLVAGSLPGETQTLPLAIFEATESGRADLALRLCALSGLLGLLLAAAAARLEPRPAPGGAA